MRFWYLFLAILTLPIGATTFRPMTVDEQLVEADGVIIGNFVRSQSVRLESGMIATQMIFKLKKEWGLQSDLFGMEEIIIHYPGGAWEDQRVEVQGVPKFIVGEKVALLAKSVDNRYWGLNLGMGSYRVIKYGQDTMLINGIFPNDSRIGQVRLEDFEIKVKKLKGSDLKVVLSPSLLEVPTQKHNRSPASLEEGKKRAIASKIEEGDNREDQSGLSVFWLVTFLAFIGGLSRFFGQKGA